MAGRCSWVAAPDAVRAERISRWLNAIEESVYHGYARLVAEWRSFGLSHMHTSRHRLVTMGAAPCQSVNYHNSCGGR